ncbi:MAG: hypothetical protein HC913_11645 [Microscillaceae bacterium]|nr:hypothetical protein [Microscillaceae bacterium]
MPNLRNLCLGSIFIFLGACLSGTDAQHQALANASQLPNGVKYQFLTQNTKGRKTKPGDRITFILRVQNHQDSILSEQRFQELPFEEPYFIAKNYYRDVFALVSEGDSLRFWIQADSLVNKAGFLKTPKIPPGTSIQYTLKVLKVQSLSDIRQHLDENLRVQREIDRQQMADFMTQLARRDSTHKFTCTDSGLCYHLAVEGKGPQPQPGDTLLVNYTSRLLDGTVYDHTEESTEFLLGQVVPNGLNEGLALMPEGSKGTFLLPSELGFGPRGMGTVVPPNSVLVFELELLKVK